VTVGGKLGFGTLKEVNVDERHDLGGSCGRRLAAAGAAQDTALSTGATGEHGQHEVAVTERVMVQH
jgi:hypothetical protein